MIPELPPKRISLSLPTVAWMKTDRAPISSASYRPEIDGLRCIAVVAVVLFHGKVPFFSGGYLGVDIFFVISGYLITRLVWTDIVRDEFSILQFYERRARRLLPALFFVCALSSIAAWYVLPTPALEEFGGHLVATGLFVANLSYWLQAGYFATRSEHLPLIHTWSLAIEEQFYVLFPLLLVATARFGLGATRTVLAVLFGLSLAVSAALSQSSATIDAAFFLLPARAWELLAGAMLALRELGRQSAKSPGSSLLHSRLAEAGLTICVLSILCFDRATPHPGIYTVIPILGTCLVIAFATPNTICGRALAFRPAVLIGLASYSIYLLNQPILAFSRVWLARDLTGLEIGLALAATFVGGIASWRWVERPFRSRNGLSSRVIAYNSAAGTLLMCVVGSLMVYWQGIPTRMGARVEEVLELIKRGNSPRSAGIRFGKCHYNQGFVPDLKKFLDELDCMPPAAAKPRILVFGDSISADKSWVLREAGYPVGNVGGAGCPLVLPRNAQEPCWHLMMKVASLIEQGNLDGIVLGQNWSGPVNENELEEIVAYWKQFRLPVLVFAGMPVFADFRNRVVKHAREGIPLEQISYEHDALIKHEASLEYLKQHGFAVLSSRDLLCGTAVPRCSAFLSGKPLVTDGTHITYTGAHTMAARLPQNSTWLQWHGSLR